MDLRFFQLRPGTPARVARAPRHRLASPPVYQPGTRIATRGEEVKDPRHTIPRAIPIALGITLALVTAVYLLPVWW